MNKYINNHTLEGNRLIHSFLNDSFKNSLEQHKHDFLASPSDQRKKRSAINITDNRSNSRSNNRSSSNKHNREFGSKQKVRISLRCNMHNF